MDETRKIIEEESQRIEKGKEEALEETKRIIEEAWAKIKTETKTPVFTPEISKAIPQIAASPEIIETVKQSVVPSKRLIDFQKLSLSPEIIKQIESQFIQESYSPFKTILSPQASFALAKRTFYTPLVKGVQTEAAEMQVPLKQQPAFERIKMMVFEGVFKKDYEATYQFLQSYLPKNHPVFTYLENEINAFDEVQKVDVKNWLGKIVGRKDRSFVKALKRYYDYVKKTEKWQFFDKNLGIHLKSSPKPLWAKKGYNLLVKRVVDKFQFIPKTYQKVFSFISRGRFNSFGVFLREKAFKPILIKLGKTAFGKAVQQGAKKAAAWLAAKLGIKAGIWAAGAAGAVPSGSVSLLIALAVEIGTRILGKIKNLIIGMIRDPEKAFLAVGSGLLILFFIPMPLALIGIIPIIIGSAGLVSFVLAPATLGVISGGISGFFTVLFGAPFTLPIILFFTTLLAILAGLTLFIVLVVSGAFILPGQISEVTPITLSPYVSEYFELAKTASIDNQEINHLENNQLPAKITYKITIKPKGSYVLTNPQISEQVTVSKKGSTPTIVPCEFEDLPQIINQPQGISLTCERDFNNNFSDSAIVNVVSLSTGVEGEVGIHKGIASASITIGKPPGECPSGWPINPNEASEAYISQGPTTSGPRASHQGQEAVDISVYNGRAVHATHEGYVTAIKTTSCGGKEIDIEGMCEGIKFTSKYLHLKSIFVSVGQTISPNFIIGESDDTGSCSTGAHLHYEFKGLKMQPPYIPRDVRGCIGNCGGL